MVGTQPWVRSGVAPGWRTALQRCRGPSRRLGKSGSSAASRGPKRWDCWGRDRKGNRKHRAATYKSTAHLCLEEYVLLRLPFDKVGVEI